jgi:lysophospholipase L1-like esterase
VNLGLVFRSLAFGAVALATLEIAARVDDYVRDDAALLKPYTISTLFRPSPFGREGVPGARFSKWQMNSLGYRGPEPQGGRSNVLTFGASETFGLYESAGHEYPRLLEAALNEGSAEGYNVVNTALPGMRIGRVGYLERAIDQTRARHVVVYPSPANYIGTEKGFCEQNSRPVGTPHGMGERFRLAGKLDQLAKKIMPLALQDLMRSAAIWWTTRNAVLLESVPAATLDALREDLRCLARAVQAKGATLVLVTHATYFGDRLEPGDTGMLRAWRRFYPELRDEGFIDLERRANAVIREVAAEHEIPLVDAATAIPRGPDHFADFVHFSDKGAALLGRLLASTILEAVRNSGATQASLGARR